MRIGTRLPRLGAPLLLALGMAACGGESGGGSEQDPAGTPDGPAPAAEQPAAPAATPAAPTGALPQGVTAEMVQQGQQVFTGAGNCVACHGPNGEGTQLAPSLTDNEWIWITPGADMHTQLVTLIKTGVSQPKQYPAPMPPMGGAQLSEEQLAAVSGYVMSISGGQGG